MIGKLKILVFVLLLSSSCAEADEITNRNALGTNFGLGGSITQVRNFSFVLGTLVDQTGDSQYYVGEQYNRELLSYGKFHFSSGVMGLVSMDTDNITSFRILPIASIKYNDVIIQSGYIPAVSENKPAVVITQILFRF